ncbi:MAG TPA: tRNA (adenosine(37)-N6)-dimethylallyltransferase MiaA [Bacteroidales bacterium]|nr:tRNA (adenosine(37)-N6)-dimethylallyltransferase MiaA [Bacteroidales bacterium]
MNNTLLVLLGPTGVGKTDISIELAKMTGAEIISADSRQFYREMRIGTAVPTEEQLRSAVHHFVQFLSIEDYYSSSLFERDVMKRLPSLFEKNNLAIMTGGSGMYIDAVTEGIDDIPDVDPIIREKYNRMYEEGGIGSLRVALRILDPDHYARVDLRNHKRIIRALEICETAGRPYSSFLKKEKRSRDFRVVKLGLNRDRDELFGRINLRVEQMMATGLEEEAMGLYPRRHLNALNTVGYRELFEYFDGTVTREKAIELIKRNSRRYAKRQLTWWARDNSIMWFHPDDKEKIYKAVTSAGSATGSDAFEAH